jgi:hypothetical protein
VGAGQEEEEVVGRATGLVDAALFDHALRLELVRAARKGVLAQAGAAGDLVVAQAGKEPAPVAGRDDARGDQILEEGLALPGAGAQRNGGQAQDAEGLVGVAAEASQAAGTDQAVEVLDKDGWGPGAAAHGGARHDVLLLPAGL